MISGSSITGPRGGSSKFTKLGDAHDDRADIVRVLVLFAILNIPLICAWTMEIPERAVPIIGLLAFVAWLLDILIVSLVVGAGVAWCSVRVLSALSKNPPDSFGLLVSSPRFLWIFVSVGYCTFTAAPWLFTKFLALVARRDPYQQAMDESYGINWAIFWLIPCSVAGVAGLAEYFSNRTRQRKQQAQQGGLYADTMRKLSRGR